MKQFGTVLGFELGNYFKNKIFVGVTIALVVLIAAVMFFPRVSEALSDPDAVDEKPLMLICADDVAVMAGIRQQFADKYRFEETADNTDKIKQAVTDGTAACAVVIASDGMSFSYYVNNDPLYDIDTPTITALLQTMYINNAMKDGGLTEAQIADIYKQMATIGGTTVSYGKDQSRNFLYTYVMIFALYAVILLYGQMVATNVATEKSSRAMELLVTSCKLVNGVHVANSMAIVGTVLREEWDYDGLVVTDWMSTGGMGTGEKYGNSSTSEFIRVGGDLVMPGRDEDLNEIVKAVDDGQLSVDSLCESAERVRVLALRKQQIGN